MRLSLFVFLCACSSAAWTDTFEGQDSRTIPDGGPPDDTGATAECMGISMSKPDVSPITVTFPGHGTPSSSIHIVAPAGTCDLSVTSDNDNVLFASDATPCATLLAPGTPGNSSATASAGNGGPNDLLFQWTYGSVCTIFDDYALSKK